MSRQSIIRLIEICMLILLFSWGCTQKGTEPDLSGIIDSEDLDQQASSSLKAYTGKIVGRSDRANTISIRDTYNDAEKSYLVKFNRKTKGLEYASPGESVVVLYVLRNGDALAMEIKPKLARLPKGVTEISPEEVRELLEKNFDFSLIDARPATRYNRSHLPGALSKPADEMASNGSVMLDKYKSQLLVFYCDGPTCGFSAKAASFARKWGYSNIRVMRAGEPGWLKAGYPVYASNDFVRRDDILLIDLRDEDSFIRGHIEHAISIPLRSLKERLSDIPEQAPVVLYGDNEKDSLIALKMLYKNHFIHVSLVQGGISGWARSGGELTAGPSVGAIQWKRKPEKGEVAVAVFKQALVSGNKDAVLLDVRTHDEVRQGKLPGSLHIPLDELGRRMNELPREKRIYIYCNTGARAEMASRELVKNGYQAFFLRAKVTCKETDCEIKE